MRSSHIKNNDAFISCGKGEDPFPVVIEIRKRAVIPFVDEHLQGMNLKDPIDARIFLFIHVKTSK